MIEFRQNGDRMALGKEMELHLSGYTVERI